MGRGPHRTKRDPRKDSTDDPHAPNDETVNADAKAHRGFSATSLRGIAKVTGAACLFALTYNILRLVALTAV